MGRYLHAFFAHNGFAAFSGRGFWARWFWRRILLLGGAVAVWGGGSALAAVPGFFPAPNAVGIPADAPLRITLPGKTALNYHGQLQVFDAATDHAVFTLNLNRSQPDSTNPANWPFHDSIAGTAVNQWPMVIVDSEAYISLHSHPLQYGTTYYVQMDSGMLALPPGTTFSGIHDKTTWRFTTAPAPQKGLSAYTVAADGSGDFCTVQGGLDFIPAGNTAPVILDIKAGVYIESIRSFGKNHITLRGRNRDSCFITYENNNNFNPGTQERELGVLFGNDLALVNLTFLNRTPQGGSQAESLFLRGDRCLVSNCTFISFQDTLHLEGRVYLSQCTNQGAVDYTWGTGIAYFSHCAIISDAAGYLVQARNAAGAYGYVFANCQLTATAGVTGVYLARNSGGGSAYAQVAYLNCALGNQILPVGWSIDATGTNTLNFGEYQSVNAQGQAVDISQRASLSHQLTDAQAQTLLDPKNVLGGTDGWDPVAALAALPVPVQQILPEKSGQISHLNLEAGSRPAVFAKGLYWDLNGRALNQSAIRRNSSLPPGIF